MTEISNLKIEQSWKKHLEPLFSDPSMQSLQETVRNLYQDETKHIYPPAKNLFYAFDLCPFDSVSVVILGQDPYHGAHLAHGLSFSVIEGTKAPPSLQNIIKEIKTDIGETTAKDDLTHWAKQGVFLLNAILTVEASKPASHHNIGWEMFTDHVIKLLSDKREHIVFMLWGNYAKQKQQLIDSNKHLVLTAAHPSPYSASNGFFGCKHFSKANEYLKQHQKQQITW